MRSVVGVVAIFGVVVACGGTGGDDLLGDSGGDASNGSDVTQGQDGTAADTGGGDTSSGGDASDATSCPDYCAGLTTKSLFCSDFDSEVAPTDWTATVASGGGAVVIAGQENVSCPNGLHASVPQAATSTSAGPIALVSKDIAAGGGHVVLDADVFLPSNDTKSYVGFLGVRPTSDQSSGAFVTHHGDAFWFVSAAGIVNGGINVAINPAPLTGAWNHMTLDVHFGQGGAGSISLTYTGSDNASHMVTGTGTTASASVSGVTVEAGMFVAGFTGSEAAFDAYYDNVVLKNGT